MFIEDVLINHLYDVRSLVITVSDKPSGNRRKVSGSLKTAQSLLVQSKQGNRAEILVTSFGGSGFSIPVYRPPWFDSRTPVAIEVFQFLFGPDSERMLVTPFGRTQSQTGLGKYNMCFLHLAVRNSRQCDSAFEDTGNGSFWSFDFDYPDEQDAEWVMNDGRIYRPIGSTLIAMDPNSSFSVYETSDDSDDDPFVYGEVILDTEGELSFVPAEDD